MKGKNLGNLVRHPKTLLPIYVVGILLAIILYVFFHYLSLGHKSNTLLSKSATKLIVHEHNGNNNGDNNDYKYLMQQQHKI